MQNKGFKEDYFMVTYSKSVVILKAKSPKNRTKERM